MWHHSPHGSSCFLPGDGSGCLDDGEHLCSGHLRPAYGPYLPTSHRPQPI